MLIFPSVGQTATSFSQGEQIWERSQDAFGLSAEGHSWLACFYRRALVACHLDHRASYHELVRREDALAALAGNKALQPV